MYYHDEGRMRSVVYSFCVPIFLSLNLVKLLKHKPSRFLVQNVHTMDELRLTGNHLKSSRPLLTFNKAFDEQPHLALIKEMLKQV